MKKSKILKKLVVVLSTTLILISAFAMSISASSVFVDGTYPYVQYGTFGNLINSSPVELEIYCTLATTSSNNPGGSNESSFCIFTQHFTHAYFDDWKANFYVYGDDVYDFWDWCLNDTRTLWASSGRSLTFSAWVSAYAAHYDIILQNFVSTYGYIDSDLAYNTGVTVGKQIGYTNGLNDVNGFRSALLTIFDSPFYIVREVFGFELFGINISSIIFALLTVGITAFVIKLVM